MHILLHAQMRTCIQLGWSHPGNPTQRGVVTEGLQARSQHKVSHMVSPQGSPRDAPQRLPIRFRQGTGTLCEKRPTIYKYISIYIHNICTYMYIDIQLYTYIYIFARPRVHIAYTPNIIIYWMPKLQGNPYIYFRKRESGMVHETARNVFLSHGFFSCMRQG